MEVKTAPSIFLSYTLSDRTSLEPLLSALASSGIKVWQDVENLRGGPEWPQRIGEEISRHDAVLLAWSAKSADHHFVRFEWNTALALGRRVIPVLLDDSPMPPSLASAHGLQIGDPGNTAREVISALGSTSTASEPPKEVLAGLAALSGSTAQADQIKTVSKALANYKNQGLITGHINAGGNVHITLNPPSKEQVEESESGGRILKILKIAGSVVALLTGVAGLVTFGRDFFKKPEPEPRPFSVLRGVVEERQGVPLAGVRVTLREKPGDTIFTNKKGGFAFDSVPGEAGARVRIYAHLEGYEPINVYDNLPGGSDSITMKRASKGRRVP